jgi:segregation and condensation protein B
MSDDFDSDPEYRIDPAHPQPDADSGTGGHEPAEPGWLDADIEVAYIQALQANEAVEDEIGPGIELGDWPVVDEEDRPEAIHELDEPAAPEPPRVTARQVVEAALFVGGKPLTAKKLASLVGPDTRTPMIEEEIECLNGLYSSEARPYEIRLAEGGYRLQLREEYEPVRNRVFGLGPKEVKLSQEQLEVLALVAYRQPISRQQIQKHGRKNAGGMLRQLLRRQLIVIVRGNNPRRDITYRTTKRFLEVFNIRNIEDLPTPDQLELR